YIGDMEGDKKMSTQDETVRALVKASKAKKARSADTLKILERVKLIFDREGIGSNREESDALYNDICAAIRGIEKEHPVINEFKQACTDVLAKLDYIGDFVRSWNPSNINYGHVGTLRSYNQVLTDIITGIESLEDK